MAYSNLNTTFIHKLAGFDDIDALHEKYKIRSIRDITTDVFTDVFFNDELCKLTYIDYTYHLINGAGRLR